MYVCLRVHVSTHAHVYTSMRALLLAPPLPHLPVWAPLCQESTKGP